jgi:hypothetical protein
VSILILLVEIHLLLAPGVAASHRQIRPPNPKPLPSSKTLAFAYCDHLAGSIKPPSTNTREGTTSGRLLGLGFERVRDATLPCVEAAPFSNARATPLQQDEPMADDNGAVSRVDSEREVMIHAGYVASFFLGHGEICSRCPWLDIVANQRQAVYHRRGQRRGGQEPMCILEGKKQASLICFSLGLPVLECFTHTMSFV